MVYSPHTNQEVSDILRLRNKSDLHISGKARGELKTDTLSLANLNTILFYEPEEMIVSVQAGIAISELQKKLSAKGQWIPTLVAEESLEHTIGAAIAMDHYHPRSKSCGALRTTILGGTFCTTNGEIFKSGSRVVKSVAGYDIHRSFCGSLGRFGIILDVTLKVQPLPEIFHRFLAPIVSREKILQLHPSCLEEFSAKLLVEISGYKEDIEADIIELESSKINIEELNDENWNAAIKSVIQLQDEEKKKYLSSDVVELLKKVQRVFDPEGVLV